MRSGNWKKFNAILGAALVIAAVFSSGTAVSFGAVPDELKSAIDARANELQKITDEIETNQKKLGATVAERKSLQTELKQIDGTIRELNLGIKASGVKIEKLGLELEKLGYEIEDIRFSVNNKKGAITALIQELWRKEREGLLALFLNDQSIAENFAENLNILNINEELGLEVAKLKALNKELEDRFAETAAKKVGVEVEQKSLRNKQSLTAEKKGEREQVLAATKSQEQLYAAQIAELEKKQAEISREIDALEEELRASFDPSLLPAKRPGVLSYPIPGAKLSQEYGRTEFAEYAYKSKFHNGLDFAAPIGTPVYAALDGRVTAVDYNDRGPARWQRYQYGRYVLVEHNNNLTSLYAHLSTATVRPGDIIKKGDLVGYVGLTGYTFGAHLHFTVYWSASIQMKSIPPAMGLVPVGVTIDPADYL